MHLKSAMKKRPLRKRGLWRKEKYHLWGMCEEIRWRQWHAGGAKGATAPGIHWGGHANWKSEKENEARWYGAPP